MSIMNQTLYIPEQQLMDIFSGADVFIDQNFNFKFDEGEFSGTTNSDGEFAIGVNNESQYQCLANRPIIVDVPVGAIDSQLLVL